jgi:CBS domain-containing protein
MRRATVSDVLTNDVITVRPETPFNEIARILTLRGISGVPVLGADDRVLGVVSENDLLRKEEFKSPAEDVPRFFETPRHRRSREQAEGTTAAEVMNTPAVAVTPTTTVVEASRLLAMRSFKRLPVVDQDERLVGIVTRRDLLRVFLRSDEDIRDEVVGEVLRHYLWQDVRFLQVDVCDGVVVLKGRLDAKSLIPIAVRLTSAVEGVVRVVDELTFELDDTGSDAQRYRR